MSATFLLGLPGKIKGLITSLAAVESKIDTVDTVVDDILVDTATIDSRTATMATNIATVDTVVDAIEVDTTEIQADLNGIIAGTTAVPGTIKSIQSGIHTMAADDIIDDVTVSAVVLAKSTVLVLAVWPYAFATTQDVQLDMPTLTSTTNLRFTRGNMGGGEPTVAISWAIIERN